MQGKSNPPLAVFCLKSGDKFRGAFWTEAAGMFREQPWIGAGREELGQRLDRAALSVRPYASHEKPPGHAHNEYLDTLAARGGVGLLFIMAFTLGGMTDVLFMLNSKRMTYLFIVLFLATTATATHAN
jgi:O-antigen ligase